MAMDASEEDEEEDSEEEAEESIASTSSRPSRQRKRPARAPAAKAKKRPKPSRPPADKRTWKKADLTSRQKSRFAWNSPPVNTDRLPQDPVKIFEMFFDDDVIDLMTTESIAYAAFKGNHTFTVSADEMRVFIAILLLSGYSTVPRRRMRWSHDKDIHNIAASEAMTRDRFEEILRYLHLKDNTRLDPEDRMSKVRPLLSMINERCLNNFVKQQSLSIDESMVPYYGRHGCRQFIRGKPIRFGYKFWILATPLGYVVQLEPYQGAKGKQVTECPGLGMGGSVVIDLIAEIQGNDAYHLTFDNLFTSLKLVDHLTTKGIGCTGTVRSNRMEDCPLKSVKDMQKANRGTYDYSKDDKTGFVAVRWNDNSVVNVVSNCVGIHPLQTANRWSRSAHQRVQIGQPFLIYHYNKTMGGVDRMDQNVDTYRVTIRTKKWWWPIFAYILDVCVQQAWLLYRHTDAATNTPLDLLAVRRAIVKNYLAKAAQPPPVGRPHGHTPQLDRRVSRAVRFDGKNHVVQWIDKQIRCALCHKKCRQKCRKCDVGLHVKCFEQFHTE
ncbi:piggyBac transposable element-derived protein 3-like [Littorina saxatilis]|uniref:piggyBac transposable element-derived protein 3-like n=1 Tax=Littorina saxatilis TaxID=31220 RepID=UPI0038B57428